MPNDEIDPGAVRDAAPGLLFCLRAVIRTAKAYDAAIERRAPEGKSWVEGDELDELYEAWKTAAESAEAFIESIKTP